MAFNNGFPISYPQMVPMYPQVPQQTMQQAQPQPPQAGSIIWVQGEAAAKSYLVAPNATVQLWDSEDKVIYLKSADASGMPSMKILDYTIRNDGPFAYREPVQHDVSYATREEVDALKGQIESLKMRIGKVAKKNEPTVSDDE